MGVGACTYLVGLLFIYPSVVELADTLDLTVLYIKKIYRMLCEYGCGLEAKYQLKNGKWCCCKSWNSCPINKEKSRQGVLNSPKHTKESYLLRWKNTSIESRKKMNWNRGLTKETDKRVYKTSETLKLHIKQGKVNRSSGKAFTEEKEKERCKKISEKRIAYLEQNPHILWKTLSNGLKVQGNWEYNVGEKLLEQGYILQRTRLIYDNVHVYTPDFDLGNGIYIEVKGWLSNRDIKKYKKVKIDNPKIKIYLMEKEEYYAFINDEIKLKDCRDLYEVLDKIPD